MKNKFLIACRGSKLSLAQVEIFKKKVWKYFPDIDFEINIQTTKGDKIQDVALDTLEGKDFFTDEIQSQLIQNGNDFAVHSMKDISSLNFFDGSQIAVIDRGFLNDIAIFNKDIIEKLKSGKEIVIGTSSPRRALAGKAFLEKMLPKFNGQKTRVTTKLIRGNVDTRLTKLENENYDGIILAITGINRLFHDQNASSSVVRLLADKKLMLLSLFSCPPAANQGALVVETRTQNTDACHILNVINDDRLQKQTQNERAVVQKYGHDGCSQMFGVFSSSIKDIDFTFATGKNLHNQPFTHWDFKAPANIKPSEILYFSDVVKKAFTYNNIENPSLDKDIENVFVTHKRTLHQEEYVEDLKHKTVWAAGTSTWAALADLGIWVNGCADGLGVQFLEQIWENTFLKNSLSETIILTNSMSRSYYSGDISNVIGCYFMIPTIDRKTIGQLQAAKAIFWTSFQQYQAYHIYLPSHIKHLSAAGRTGQLLIEAGANPIIYPTINAFKQWKSTL